MSKVPNPHPSTSRRPGPSSSSRPTAAVVGSGISGLTAAYLLSRSYDVTLYEAQSHIGGHTHTHHVTDLTGQKLAIDSGFIVFNNRTYPTLLRLFTELSVKTQHTDMSMAVSCDGCGLEYSGISTKYVSRATLVKPAFLRLMAEVPRFQRAARKVLADPSAPLGTYGEFLAAGRYSRYFIEHFAAPLVACVWSCPQELALDYPARYLFEFMSNHGWLAVRNIPQWMTVTGGSSTYVAAIESYLPALRSETPVAGLRRCATGIELRDGNDHTAHFDAAVIATHADEALALLEHPTEQQIKALSPFRYSDNETILHQDTSLLPRSPKAWSSWNYKMGTCGGRPDGVQVSYYMNRLQHLHTDQRYIVSLNPHTTPNAQIMRMHYTHPIYSAASVAAQKDLPSLSDERLAFAGAYHGWGFHEDGCASGVRAAASLKVPW